MQQAGAVIMATLQVHLHQWCLAGLGSSFLLLRLQEDLRQMPLARLDLLDLLEALRQPMHRACWTAGASTGGTGMFLGRLVSMTLAAKAEILRWGPWRCLMILMCLRRMSSRPWASSST